MPAVNLERLRGAIADRTGAYVADMRYLAGGHNTSLYVADLKGNRRLAVKIAERSGAQLDLEAWMLDYLKEHSRLPVPEVVLAESDVLVMTYLPTSGALDGQAEEHAAELLAGLHGVRASSYGLERDTLIGPLPQPNGQMDDWLAFFRDRRLMHMAHAALEAGRIDNRLMKSIEKLAGRLDEYITAPAPPCLLHGDVWGGNVMAVPGRITGFIDPAIYYGDPEIELAFSTMFSTFGEKFFKRYGEIVPLRDGFFEVRRDLYNLYPLLVHARLFGRSFAESVNRTVDRLAA